METFIGGSRDDCCQHPAGFFIDARWDNATWNCPDGRFQYPNSMALRNAIVERTASCRFARSEMCDLLADIDALLAGLESLAQ